MEKISLKGTRNHFLIRMIIITVTAVLFISALLLINRPVSAEDSRIPVSRTYNITRSADNEDNKISYTTYVVREGDTIWSIADRNMTEDFPTHNSFIDEVMRANQMDDSSIYPGDLIIIPSDNEN